MRARYACLVLGLERAEQLVDEFVRLLLFVLAVAVQSPELVVQKAELQLDWVCVVLAQIGLNCLRVDFIKKLHPILGEDLLHPLEGREVLVLLGEMLDVGENVRFAGLRLILRGSFAKLFVWLFFRNYWLALGRDSRLVFGGLRRLWVIPGDLNFRGGFNFWSRIPMEGHFVAFFDPDPRFFEG